MSVVNLSIIIWFQISLWLQLENGRILQISVQEQHCENGLQSFDDSYLQHKLQKKCALNTLFKVTPIVNRGNFKSCIL